MVLISRYERSPKTWAIHMVAIFFLKLSLEWRNGVRRKYIGMQAVPQRGHLGVTAVLTPLIRGSWICGFKFNGKSSLTVNILKPLSMSARCPRNLNSVIEIL